MYDPVKCLRNAQIIDPGARLCSESTCTRPDIAAAIQKFCDCQPPYPPQNPCPYGPDSPVVVFDSSAGMCYCCCGGASARVAVDAGEEHDVGDVWVGHMVRVARRGASPP